MRMLPPGTSETSERSVSAAVLRAAENPADADGPNVEESVNVIELAPVLLTQPLWNAAPTPPSAGGAIVAVDGVVLSSRNVSPVDHGEYWPAASRIRA